MIRDQGLLDQLGSFPVEKFHGDVFRAVGLTLDPLAPSVSGGRWAPAARAGIDISVLYTSFEREGALAEVAAYLALLTPLPPKPLKVARLEVCTRRTLRLARAELVELGVDMAHYGERDYRRTQDIGAALAFLEVDGLISPSARWPCDNLTIFTANHLGGRLELMDSETVDWRAWAKEWHLLDEHLR
jgi:hypothetical protein